MIISDHTAKVTALYSTSAATVLLFLEKGRFNLILADQHTAATTSATVLSLEEGLFNLIVLDHTALRVHGSR